MEKEYKIILGKLIKEKRKTKKYSLLKASKVCDVSLSTFSRIENGSELVTNETYLYVGKYFDIPLNLNYYNNLFNKLYDSIVTSYIHDTVKDNWKTIIEIKDELINSPYKYRYFLYKSNMSFT